MTILDSLSVEFNASKGTYKEIPLAELDLLKPGSEGNMYWIHCNSNQEEIFKKLCQTLALPENVIELCDKNESMPMLLDSGSSLTIRVRCLLSQYFSKDQPINYGSMVIHLTAHYCLTVTADDLPAVHEFNSEYSKAIKYAKTPCFILFLMMDDIINNYAKILYDIEVDTDEIDLEIRTDADSSTYQEIVFIKKQIMKIKRFMTSIRDILMRISGRKMEVISEQCRLSLYNLFDHTQMIAVKADAIRENLNSTLDQIDNALMNRMSESMKVLTAFSAIFLPLTVITGIYGMNFDVMPELQWRFGYLWAISLMLICAGLLLFLFKKMKWL